MMQNVLGDHTGLEIKETSGVWSSPWEKWDFAQISSRKIIYKKYGGGSSGYGSGRGISDTFQVALPAPFS